MRQDSEPAPRSRLATILFLGLLIAGAWLRLAHLERRPLHGDEAVGASLSLDVARNGSFLYDSANRHGPFQYFLDGWVMRWKGTSTFWIRFPFALAGSLLVLALLPLRAALGEAGWLFAASLLTCSPFFVYYSRYAIQEILFVTATALFLACAAAFARSGRGPALLGAALAAGWMVSLKESFVIVWGCAVAAALLGVLCGGGRFRAAWKSATGWLATRWSWGLLGAAAGGLLAATFYTDLFRNRAGLVNLAFNLADLLRHGASTAAAVELHRHPASFYASLLGRYEWPSVAGLVAGAALALRSRRPLSLFLAAYAVLSLAVHFLLAYKTPWLLLSPLLVMALLAGDAWGRVAPRLPRISFAAGCWMAALLPLLLLPATLRTSFQRPADPSLGLAYHHAGAEQMDLARDIRRAIATAPPDELPKAIVALPYYWPLAWYLRDEVDVQFDSSPVPEEPEAVLARVPILVTLQSADPKFLEAFVPGGEVPRFSLPGHASRPVVLIPSRLPRRAGLDAAGHAALKDAGAECSTSGDGAGAEAN